MSSSDKDERKKWNLWSVNSDQDHSKTPSVQLTTYNKIDSADAPVYDNSYTDSYQENTYVNEAVGRGTLKSEGSIDSANDSGIVELDVSKLNQLPRRKVEFPPMGDGDDENNTAFRKATERKKSQWDEYLVNVDVKRSIASGMFKVTLHQLARDGETDTLNKMLQSIPEIQRRRLVNGSTDDEGATALHLAARHNHYNVCELLINSGSNVDARGEGRATPLHFAARYKYKQKRSTDDPYVNEQTKGVIALLAERGAHINFVDIEGQTPLHSASIKGNLHAVRQLLKCRGCGIDNTDSQGMTALQMAATHGHVEIVQLLLEQGADFQMYDNDLMTALHFACSEGSIDIVRQILREGERAGGMGLVKKMMMRPDAGKNTCLHVTVNKGHRDLTLELIAWSGKLDEVLQFVNLSRAHNVTPLHIAASQGHMEITKLLIESGARVNARNDSLATPLLLAAQHNNFAIVELLLQYNAELEIRDKDNLTPLLIVCKQGHLETISWLVENNADVTATDKNDKNCLMLAVEDKRTSAVQELLRYEAVRKLLEETDKNANSVLHLAAKKGFLPIIRILLEHDARIDPKNEDESTPVHIAAAYGQHMALKELLDHDKTMINSLDENANTALHLSAMEGHTTCIEVLLDHGANVGLRNTKQWTALDCACSKGFELTVQKLLQAQSPLNPLRGARTTPLHQACVNGHVHVVKILLDWRADVSYRLVDGRNPLDCAIDADKRECVQAIIQHSSWKNAMRNGYTDPLTDLIVTPVRKLIVKMPDMAELAFSRCITDNKKPPDDLSLEVKLDYEFLDDMYTVIQWNDSHHNDHDDDSGKKPVIPETGYEAFNDHGKLTKSAITYTEDTSVLRHNHPLSIMVNRKRERLLQHPVVTALLQYKWKKYGGLVYYSSLIFLMLFVGLLNCYLIFIPPPYSIDYLKSLGNRRFYGEFTADHINNYTAPETCFSLLQSGAEYRGFENIGESGKPCLPWSRTSTNSHLFPDAGLDSNFCRNPGTQLKKPWCYTNYSDTDAALRTREACNVTSCPISVKGSNVPLGATCHFPFKYKGAEFTECLIHSTGGIWCAYTYNFDQDVKWGYCSEEDSLCNVAKEHKKPCGSPGTNKLNCEARGCCYVVNDAGKPTEWTECFQKLDPCSDRSSYCPVYKKQGLCEASRPQMETRCALTCEYCNVTEAVKNSEYQEFLYIMSVYPEQTFDSAWESTCYYVLPGAHAKWGDSCHFIKVWQEPARIALLVLSLINLGLLVMQVWNYQLEAFQPVFFLELILFVLCLLLSLNFNEFDLKYTREMLSEQEIYRPLVEAFQSETGLRQNWQWQCGVMALFLSWMNLLLYIRKIPYLGIYVVMFNDVFKTFVKFSLVFLLFILSFAFTFHTLLQNEPQFEQSFNAILKTTVMMVGEIDFGGIFFGDQDTFSNQVFYKEVTYLVFSIFIIVMMIIVMNLLVGLAVGDIIEVKEHATLERLKMQVELALEVEFSVPNFLRKKFVRKEETVHPNKYRKSNALKRALLQNQDLSSKNIANAMNPNKSQTEEIRENVENLNHIVRSVRNKTGEVETLVRELIAEFRETNGNETTNMEDKLSKHKVKMSKKKKKIKSAKVEQKDIPAVQVLTKQGFDDDQMYETVLNDV
ncbi:transient receptor potential cation channel subfamily A member 1 homolog [Ciona intestinalis]